MEEELVVVRAWSAEGAARWAQHPAYRAQHRQHTQLHPTLRPPGYLRTRARLAVREAVHKLRRCICACTCADARRPAFARNCATSLLNSPCALMC
eukprot:1332140-Pleurochrysis_carterae.AAC.2